jgi:hypothetical protein
MSRTTVLLPANLKSRALRRAREKGLSLSDFIREAVAAALREPVPEAAQDPLFADEAVFDGPCPADLAERHDHYLYGERG